MALTFRVQADEDIMILSGARGKHPDPSLKASKLPRGSLPTTVKIGMDATIPEGVDMGDYEMAEYAFREEVRRRITPEREGQRGSPWASGVSAGAGPGLSASREALFSPPRGQGGSG